MHLAPLIIDLATILAVAAFMSFIFNKIKQPVVLGYILAGVIVGPHTPPITLITDTPGIQTWAELGVIFLMFTLGLEFSFRKLLSVGVTAGIAASFEVVFFLGVGYALGNAFGWSQMDSIFLGAMLSISSTTIIIKALDELKLKTHRFATLIFGILIVEDLMAIIMLVALTAVATTSNFSLVTFLETGLNLVLVVGGWFITGYFIVPKIMAYVGRKGNNEMLTLVSTGLCLLLVVLATRLGYSTALGAFIMGSILAETPIIHRIEGLMSPIKDLFGAIFFVSIGMLIDPRIMIEYWGIILILSAVTIGGKIFSTSMGSLAAGQSFKNSIQVGFGLAQIGEFSFIIASLGLTLKVTSEKLYPIGVGVSILTTFTTPYLIKYSHPVAEFLENLLPLGLKNNLERYATWAHRRNHKSKNSKDIQKLLLRWFANGIIVTLIFNLNTGLLASMFKINLDALNPFYRNLTWFVTLAVASPFIWAMVFTSKKNYLRIRKEKNLYQASVILALPVFTCIWIGLLCAQYFPIKYVISIMGVILLVVYFFLYKQLESYYRWFEKSFLKTFDPKAAAKSAHHEILTSLAPWDSHFVNIEVHPNAELVNKSLMESGVRNRFGINIVAIQRGQHTIVAPKPQEMILPKDTLVVLGTDVQLDALRPLLEIPIEVSAIYPSSANYRLKHISLKPGSSLVGLSIRESGIREKYHAMVIGIERDQSRIINPDTDLKLKALDTLWVVGEQVMLEGLISELT
jgi:monovalent cation:H+ antiporter-2, CPA2 family